MSRKNSHGWLLRYRGKYRVSPIQMQGKKMDCFSSFFLMFCHPPFTAPASSIPTCPTSVRLAAVVGPPLPLTFGVSIQWGRISEAVVDTHYVSTHKSSSLDKTPCASCTDELQYVH